MRKINKYIKSYAPESDPYYATAVPLVVNDDLQGYEQAERERGFSISLARAEDTVVSRKLNRSAMKKIGDFVTRRKFPSATEIALEQEALCAEYDDRMVERMINKGEAENRTEAVRILEFMWQELDYKSTEQIKALKKAVDKQDEELGTTEIADALRKASEQIIHVMLEYRSRESFKKMKDKIATAGILTLEEMEEIERKNDQERDDILEKFYLEEMNKIKIKHDQDIDRMKFYKKAR